MLADCLANESPFGITPAGATAEPPPPGAVGCIAEIRATRELADGRSNIVVFGGTRFHLIRTLEERAPYHVALVEDFEEEPGTEPGPEATDALRHLFIRYFDAFRKLNDSEGAPSLADDAMALSFQAAAIVDCDLSVKQLMLTTRSTRERVTMLLQLLPPLTGAVERAVAIHHRAPTNGTGGSRPDLLEL